MRRDASPIWSPHLAGDQYKLETVQHKFLRYLSSENGKIMDPFLHDYSKIMNYTKYQLLNRIKKLGMYFLHLN